MERQYLKMRYKFVPFFTTPRLFHSFFQENIFGTLKLVIILLIDRIGLEILKLLRPKFLENNEGGS